MRRPCSSVVSGNVSANTGGAFSEPDSARVRVARVGGVGDNIEEKGSVVRGILDDLQKRFQGKVIPGAEFFLTLHRLHGICRDQTITWEHYGDRMLRAQATVASTKKSTIPRRKSCWNGAARLCKVRYVHVRDYCEHFWNYPYM